jgi:hypothetical protein
MQRCGIRFRRHCRASGLRTATLTYGHYREEESHTLLKRSRSMVFLCEHETQGLALQQTLSCDIPVFAWDLGGVWQDTDYYPIASTLDARGNSRRNGKDQGQVKHGLDRISNTLRFRSVD